MKTKEKLKNLLKLTNEELGLYLVDKDLMSNKIDEDFKPELVNNSIKTGIEEAKKILNRYNNFEIRDILKSMNLEVIDKKTDNSFNYIYMGVFEEPNKIFLYGDNIREAEKLMGKYKDILGDIKLKDIILAHEVFHAIEWENPSLYTNTVKVEVLKIGPFRRKSIVLCAGEIAAMEFAKRVLDLNYNPILLNFLFMNIWNEEEAENLYNKLISYRR